MSEQQRVAVFIDADNMSPKFVPAIMSELMAKYGEVTYRRAYGNWLHSNAKWEELFTRYSMQPVYQPANAKGKNSADIKLIIDAMDALYTAAAEIFCIVSSDSDYTALAVRLREGGKTVVGIGEHKKVKDTSPLARACSKFVFVENLLDDAEASEPNADGSLGGGEQPAPTPEASIENVIVDIITANSDGANGMNLSQLKQAVVNRRPDFDERTYGFSSFSKYLAGFDELELIPPDAPKAVRVVGGGRRTSQVFSFIRDFVIEAGARGRTVSEISGAFSTAFPGQRIRGLGYTRMNKLLEDVPDVQLVTERDGTVIVVPEG